MPEQRKLKRYSADWPVIISGTTYKDDQFEERGVLRNVSARGCMVILPRFYPTGQDVKVHLRMPMKQQHWLLYRSKVVRIEPAGEMIAVTLKFNSVWPYSLDSPSLDIVQFPSCFISYSAKDEEFATQLSRRLQKEQINVWHALKSMRAGKKMFDLKSSKNGNALMVILVKT
jgi:hypothetical protein